MSQDIQAPEVQATEAQASEARLAASSPSAKRRIPMALVVGVGMVLALGGWWLVDQRQTQAQQEAADAAAASTPTSAAPSGEAQGIPERVTAGVQASAAQASAAQASAAQASAANPGAQASGASVPAAPGAAVQAQVVPAGINRRVTMTPRPANPFQPLVIDPAAEAKDVAASPSRPEPVRAEPPAPTPVAAPLATSGGALPLPTIGSGVLPLTPIPGGSASSVVRPAPVVVQPARPSPVGAAPVVVRAPANQGAGSQQPDLQQPASQQPAVQPAPRPVSTSPLHDRLAADLRATGAMLEAVIFGEPDAALLRSSEGYFSLVAGQALPGTQLMLERVEPEFIVFSRDGLQIRLTMAAQGILVPARPLEPADRPAADPAESVDPTSARPLSAPLAHDAAARPASLSPAVPRERDIPALPGSLEVQ